MESKAIIINSMFNVNPYPTNPKEVCTLEWIKDRIKIFQEFTLKSLKLQTNQNFNAFICYQDSNDEIIKAELNRYESLPDNVHFVMKSEYQEKIKKCLKGHEYVYFVRLDTDDAYHKSLVQQLYDYKPQKGTASLINRSGYIYDSINKEIGKAFCKVVTFYTFIYKVEDYLEGNVFNHDFTDVDTEQYIALKVPHEFIEKRNYLWHVHNKNAVTNFDSWFIQVDDRTKNIKTISKIISEYIGSDSV